jgi:parvulin-like peptidyl-prolyl isomerase
MFYVLRFTEGADVNLRRWMMMALAALALAACGSPAVGAPVARLDNVILSQQELDSRVARAEEAAQALATKQGQPAPSKDEITRQLVEQFIQQNLVLNVARQRGVSISDTEVDDLIAQIRGNIQANPAGLTLDDAIHAQLGLAGPDAPEFRGFISSLVAQRKLSETLVTTDTVRQEMTTQLQAQTSQKTDQVHAAHILIRTEQGADQAALGAAEKKAQDIIDRIVQGENFEELAKQLSEDPGSGANGGDLGWLQQGQTVPEFDKAIFQDLKPGEITKTPVKTDFGYHIIKVLGREQRASMSEEEAKQQLEQGIDRELQNRRSQALQELLASEREKAKAENRLVEPNFPTPQPQPAPGQEQPAPGQAQPTTQP